EQLYRELMRRRRANADALGSDGGTLLVDEEDAEQIDEAQDTSRTDTRPQLRDAVVLVARLGGLLELEATLDPEDAHILTAAFQERVQRIVQEFGGVADRRVGSNVLAVFGVPNAYGNEAERGVRAALLLRESVAHEAWP